MAISRQSRNDLVDLILLEGMPWSGRLDDVAFLSRLFDLDKLPSRDTRFKNARGDIWQHRVNNLEDWDDDWVFHDSRFNVAGGNDDLLLSFLCEMLHPVVLTDDEQRSTLVKSFNEILRPEGWEIVRGQRKIGGRTVYVARPIADDRGALADTAEKIAVALDSEYVSKQIQRMETAIDSDVDLAIGTAKEFVETVAKSILDERDIDHDENAAITSLVRATSEALGLVPEGIPNEAKAAKSVKAVLGNLASIVQGMAEIRNAYALVTARSPRRARSSPATLSSRSEQQSQLVPFSSKRIAKGTEKRDQLLISHIAATSSP